jgi:hypothetical protein
MELFLNLAWIALAAAMCWLFMRYAPRERGDRRTQLVALALVILILFPVISVTDDLTMAQNPAETDCCQRKGHVYAGTHATLHPVAILISSTIAALCSHSFNFAAPAHMIAPHVSVPALDSIENRPPPAA